MDALDADVADNQRRRIVCYEALREGRFTSWDYQPVADASIRFMRNHLDLNVVEASSRVPVRDVQRASTVAPDGGCGCAHRGERRPVSAPEAGASADDAAYDYVVVGAGSAGCVLGGQALRGPRRQRRAARGRRLGREPADPDADRAVDPE